MKNLMAGVYLLVATTSFADDIQLGKPIYGGNGCPQGSASAVLSSDRKTLSILFDKYQAEAGYTTGRSSDRKSCNIAIPVHVPHGYSISLLKMDYRGFNFLEEGASSRLTVDYFFAGQRGPRTTEYFDGPLNRNYFVSNQLVAEAVVWSPCGADTNLRVNSSIVATTNEYDDQTVATVDSADIKAGIVYQVQWRTCQ